MKKKVVILGGGTAGWVSAAVLSKALSPQEFEFELVESPDMPTVGVGEASIPAFYGLLSFLGISDKPLLEGADATFKYGIEFEDWSQPNERYMHGFGKLGCAFKDTSFFDAWLTHAHRIAEPTLGEYLPTEQASNLNKFGRNTSRPDNAPKSAFYPSNNLYYALHFDALRLAEILKEFAKKRGVKHTQGTVERVRKDDSGIQALLLKEGFVVRGDLFVDASGLAGRLIKQELNAEFDDWSHWLLCNSAMAMQSQAQQPLPPYTRSVAQAAGWTWHIPLQNRMGNGYVYCDRFITDERVEQVLRQSLSGAPINDPKIIRFTTGRLHSPWEKNCIAIGLSAAFLEPLESTSIHLIIKAAISLASELHTRKPIADAAVAFNDLHERDTLQIRDFLILHYLVNQREQPFWLAARSIDVPESLQAQLQSFTETGKVNLSSDALFGPESWYQVLIGQKYLANYQAFASDQHGDLTGFFSSVKQAISQEVGKLDDHSSYIKQLLQREQQLSKA
ncbi:tryptophan halogenase family protein [Paraferrimonas haliotis]|uniref:tryptophan halogenase family protein n=1 Tax=Paraferrimonas haliotis TaxID=2013866 RepID=UPI000BA9C246|nr:tryptophan halogenase family protein [Paraferrimonas haliotis]